MLEGRSSHGLAVLHGELWALGGSDNSSNVHHSCERLDEATNAWVRGPDMSTKRIRFGVAILNGESWAVGAWISRSRISSFIGRANAWTLPPAGGFLAPTCSWHVMATALLCSVVSYGPLVDGLRPLLCLRAYLTAPANACTRRGTNGSQDQP